MDQGIGTSEEMHADRGQRLEPPPEAVSAIQAACGELAPERLFVIPRATHLAGLRPIATPTEVLGFGDSVVALWVEDGMQGRLTSVPIDELLFVEDRQILLYGKLRLMAANSGIAVRYNTASRDSLQPGLDALRRTMAGTVLPVDSAFVWMDGSKAGRGPDELPHKWAVVLEFASVRPDLTEPARIAVGNVAAPRTRSGPACGVALLGARELVIASEPPEYLDDTTRYGVDVLAVPRDRLSSLAWTGEYLNVRVVGRATGQQATVSLPLDASLVEAMRWSFGSLMRWD